MARVYRPEEGVRFIEAGGLRFGYFEWGAGPIVLLLHGFPDTAHTWDRIGPGLAAAGFRVIAPFLRGYAPSAMASRDTDAETLGRDVLALAAAFGGDVRVVGHDWGAEAVYAAASLGAEGIERLVAVAIPHRATVPLTPGLLWSLRHFIAFKLPGAEARFARSDCEQVSVLWHRWSPTWSFDDADLEPVKNALAAPDCLRSALGYYRAASFRTPAFMRRPISVPTLAVAGSDDPGISVAAYEHARIHFGGDYAVRAIPGGHFCHRESPQAFLDAVIPFLRR